MKLLLAFILLFNMPVIAEECPRDVQIITEGEKANCFGFLFSPKAEEQAAKAVDEAKYNKELNDRLMKRKELTDKEINILDKRLQLYVEQSEILSKQIVSKENNEGLYKFGYFILGVAVTGYLAANLK